MSPLIQTIISGVAVAAIGAGVTAYVSMSNQIARLENEAEHTSSDLGLLKLDVKEIRKALATHSIVSSPRPLDDESFQGAITHPDPNFTVGQSFTVEGTVSEEIPPYHHLWLVVRRGEMMWPKDPEVFLVDRRWKKQMTEAGTGGFSVVLYLMDQAEHDRIMKWVRDGNDTGDFPGFLSFTGEPLAQVELIGG